MSRIVKARFTLEERDLIIEQKLFMDPSVEERIRNKRGNRGSVSIELSREELTDLIGCIAAEANHTKKRMVAAVLNEICDELESLENEMRYN